MKTAFIRFANLLLEIGTVKSKNDQPIAELRPAPGSRRATWADLNEKLNGLPHDPTFADDLEKVNQADQLPKNPWA